MKTSNEPTRREHRHQSTRDEIMQAARQHMAEQGAAALSLRAIARQMRLTAPALYRYFASRDDLVTALIVTAYDSLADALEAARDAAFDTHANRIFTACLAYRKWALAHPQDYALIFGTPIPGYDAPDETTLPAAKRSMDVFIDLLQAAETAGRLKPVPAYAKPSPALQAALSKWKKNFSYSASTVAMHFALVGWGRMHGMILLELFNHIQPFWQDPAELYASEVASLLSLAGLQVDRKTKKK